MDLVDSDDEMMAVEAALLSDEDDDDSGEEGAREEFVPMDMAGWRTMSNASFKENFRMDRVVFQMLITEVWNHLHRENRLLRLRTPPDLCLMMALWPVFNPDTFRSSGHHFGRRKGSIYFHYAYVIEALREMAPRYIKWPGALEREEIKASFEAEYGFPGVVGSIDGVHIVCTAPLEQPQRYVNRHHAYSILVQAVCDHRLLYRDVYCGQPGSIGDVRNFERSPLSRNLLTYQNLLSDGEHITGDGAYTCTSKVLTPYIDDGHTTARQRRFNYLLSTCRSSVERSFCLLRGKNRRLKYLPMRNRLYQNDHIIASFVLHNFMILNGNDSEGLPPANPIHLAEDEHQRLFNEARNDGIMKREFIAHMLFGDD